MKVGYGYRLIQNTVFGNDPIDNHIGAYGFETEEAAVKDAKRRLQEEIKQSAIFVWSIQSYSYTRNKEGDIDET
ncbi:hypothetical protein [Pseudobutyrivibrio sp.]|uniref:hypothetical protein n=1 Tax=Pseudobutyrivibrio sp. TaxID=2014367 RepID=UPI00386401D1